MSTDLERARLEAVVGRLMLAGVTSSAVCMVAGLAMFLGTADVTTATRLVTIGLVVLMATPAMRVAAAVLEAVRTRDWTFVAITGMVVLILGLTLVLALQRVS